MAPHEPATNPGLRRLRTRRLDVTVIAQAVGTQPSRVSALEHGRDHNHLATRYQDWLRAHQPAPSST